MGPVGFFLHKSRGKLDMNDHLSCSINTLSSVDSVDRLGYAMKAVKQTTVCVEHNL